MNAAAEVEVDSAEQAQADEQPATRRRIVTASMGAGERKRVVDVVIGEFEYDARCPKLVVWTDMAQIVADQQPRNRSDRRKAGDKAPAGEGRVTTDRVRLTSAMSHFLRGCLNAADWAAIEADLSDPDSDLDLPDVWAAGIKLVVEFKPDMKAMADSIGMKVPGVLDQLGDQLDADAGTARPAKAAAKAAPRKRASRAR